jgi:hypothetical protein
MEQNKQTPVQTFEEIQADVRAKLKQLQKTKQLDDLDAEVLFDPWDSQDPFVIIGNIPPDEKYPKGQALAWKNPILRNQSANIGWKGWIPLEYGDPYTGENGEMLTEYLQEAPARLEGTKNLDNMVRRGDSILCRLDMRAWMRRQIEREAKSLEMRNALRRISEDEARVGITGEGLVDQEVPRGGFRPQDNEVPGGKNLVLRTGPNKRLTNPKED